MTVKTTNEPTLCRGTVSVCVQHAEKPLPPTETLAMKKSTIKKQIMFEKSNKEQTQFAMKYVMADFDA